MKKMILKDNSNGYEKSLKIGQVYSVIEEEGIFKINPYVKVYNEKGEQIAHAHKRRFKEVENDKVHTDNQE